MSLSNKLRRIPSGRMALLALLCALAGCGNSTMTETAVGSTARPSTATSGTSTSRPKEAPSSIVSVPPPPLAFGFRRCEVLLSTGVVDGQLSDDPKIARAQQWRADNGLRSDEQWVREVPTLNRTSVYADAFDAPLSDDEVEELTSRGADIDSEALAAYTAEHQATFGGYWLDHTTRSPTISFTEEVDLRRREVAERIPGVLVVQANLTEAQLSALQNKLTHELTDRGLPLSSGTLIQAGGGVVSIGIPVLDEPTVAVVAEVADPALTCLEGQELDRYTPPGPQAESGNAWRLLGLREVDLPLQVISDQADLEQVWREFAPAEDLPTVDFADEIVVTVPTRGFGVNNGPCGTRFDGWQIADGVVRLDLPSPGGAAVCLAIAVPGAYVIALDASDIPSGRVEIEVVSKQLDGPIMSASFDR